MRTPVQPTKTRLSLWAFIGLFALAACYQTDPFATGDDDDIAPVDDDDDATNPDDDDATGSDDDDATSSDDDDDATADDDDTTLPVGDPVPDPDQLIGRVYSLDLGGATFIEPPGAGPILEAQLADQYLLFSLTEASSFAPADQPGVHVVGGSGDLQPDGSVIQDLCNESLNLTAGPDDEFGTGDDIQANWVNPSMELGPADITVDVSGSPTLLVDVVITGRFEPDLSAFVEGTIAAVLDLRPLDASLGGELGAACAFLLEGYGVACHECGAPDPGEYCVDIEAVGLLGNYLDDTVLVPRSCSDIIWNYVATGACTSSAQGYDDDGTGTLDGTYQGCPEFDG